MTIQAFVIPSSAITANVFKTVQTVHPQEDKKKCIILHTNTENGYIVGQFTNSKRTYLIKWRNTCVMVLCFSKNIYKLLSAQQHLHDYPSTMQIAKDSTQNYTYNNN